MADGLQLVHELGVREELRHRAEGKAAEVLVEPGDDDADAAIREVERAARRRLAEELHLVDPDDVEALRVRSAISATDVTGTARIRAPAWLTTSVAS